MVRQLKKSDWERIAKVLHSCVFCLSKEHSSFDCPYKKIKSREKDAEKELEEEGRR